MSHRALKSVIAKAMVVASRRRNPHPTDAELERLHLSPDIEHFNDSSYFFGADGQGLAIATRMAFRTGKLDEAWLELRLPEIGVFRLNGEAGPRAGGDTFGLGALEFRCLEVGRRWFIGYVGDVTGDEGDVKVEVELVFQASTPIIDFGRIADPFAVARAMANRPWTKEFFERMREVKKVHYEQGGTLRGQIFIDGKPLEINLRAVRDHSYGRRVWAQWERHLWLLGTLSDGSFINLSMVRYDFIDSLRAGWRCRDGQVKSIVDFEDFDHFGPAQEPPQRFDVRCRNVDGYQEHVLISAEDAFDFELDGGAYRIREWIAKFQIGGVTGVGVAEFGWNPAQLPS